MPIYEYLCQECGHKLEVMQRMGDERLKTCPDCNQDALQKLISAGAFQLKGTGWYETDFKNSGKPAEKKTADGDGGSPSKASDTATESGDTKAKSGDAGSKSGDAAAAKKPDKPAPKSNASPSGD